MLEPSQRLRHAIIQGNLPITKRLLARFPELWLNPDPNHKGWSNLHYASFHGHYLICFHLISFMNQTLGNLHNNYCHLDLLTFDELSVLHLSSLAQRSQTLHYLLQEFPGKLWLDFPGGRCKQTPAHFCCINGFKEGIKLLLEFGADWELQDLDGNTCLHLCLEFGNFDCIQVLLRYLASLPGSKDACVQRIRDYENVKNSKGWTAIEYASSFDLISRYEGLKNDLLSDAETAESAALVSTPRQDVALEHNSSQTSLPGNKVLASPIVPVAQAQKEDEGTRSDPETSSGGRAHSRSLPSSSGPEIKPLTSSSRKRAQTTYSYKPPASINSNLQSPRSSVPQTPSSNRTPSLKSFTISPSVRNNNYDENDDFLPPPSPQSTLSNASSINNSPINASDLPQLGRKKSSSFSNTPFQLTALTTFPLDKDEHQWPIIKASPTHIVNQVLPESGPVHEFQISRAARSSSSFSSSPSPVLSAQRSQVDLRSDPIKSPAKQSENYRNEIARTPAAQMSKSRSSSASSIAAKVAFSSSRSSLIDSPVRRPSISNRSSSGGASAFSVTGEISPVLRKTRSSGTLPAGNSSGALNLTSSTTILEQPSQSVPRAMSPVKTGGSTSLSRTSSKSASSDSLKRSNISKVSFSRIR